MASLSCAKPFRIANFEKVYLPRTYYLALAPIANYSSEPEGAAAGASIRDAIYDELVRRYDEYTVRIQDIAVTDAKLRQAGIEDSAAAVMPGPELARLLGVDAVMTGSVLRYDKKGIGTQFMTAVLFGFASGSEVSGRVAIQDGTDGRVVWFYNIDKIGGALSSPDDLRDSVGRDVADRFPYKKQ